MAERDDRGMLRWKCWGRGDGSGGGDGGDGDCGARSHAACRGGPPWYAGEESSRAGRIFFASCALYASCVRGTDFGFGPTRVSETAFYPPRNRPSAPNRFASRHLYQFQERSRCPPIPIGRYAAGYRGAIIFSSHQNGSTLYDAWARWGEKGAAMREGRGGAGQG